MKISGANQSSASETPRMAGIAERSVSFDDDSVDDLDTNMEEYDDLEAKANAPAVVTPETPEGAIVTTTRSGGTRSLSRNLAKELADVARPDPAYSDDDDDDYGEEKPSTKTDKSSAKPQGNRPPLNGDTPAANKILGRCLELMLKESEWVPMFAPRPVRQAVWVDLSNELEWPVNSTSSRQVADDTVSLLMAMGIEAQSYPSGLALQDWKPAAAGVELHKWKKKLRSAFGATRIGAGRQPVARQAGQAIDPANILLPKTPKRKEDTSVDGDATNKTFAGYGWI
ncbi:hypothetical protein PR002_g8320 [Phytophthora rubi]|uniref:Eukaryotic/viral aspartic protease n=1 Tax=Phytophthora rubi TaxID=129364 RepID=A0A6A3MMK0_9STRA|nr:hypothetical protein PR002_g8320 [Phytophthora rubi]